MDLGARPPAKSNGEAKAAKLSTGNSKAALEAAVASFGVAGDKAERLRIWLQNNLTPEGRFIDKAEMDRRAAKAIEVERASHPGKTGESFDEGSYFQANGGEATRQRGDLDCLLGNIVPFERQETKAGLPALGREQEPLPPSPDRESLLLSAWINRDIPLRDYLLGGVMCTTSRWFGIGETGIGKTLFGGALAGACAKGEGFLNWEARRPSRVMYLDGELPIETFKERMQLVADRYGSDLQFYGYNRESLGFDGMPPLNTPPGQAWLRREIDAVKPDLIIFDSIMCLLVGPMQDETTWAPMKPLVCELSARKIAQVWFNHANDLGKSFGDKTREWEMDTVFKLSKVEGDETAISLEFLKARLRTPKTAGQFASLIIRPADDWQFEIAKAGVAGKQGGDVEIVRDEIIKAYDHLADGVTKTLGLDDRSSVRKVPVASIREELKDRGILDLDDKGNIERVSRNHFSRAKKLLLVRRGGAGLFAERKGQIWRT
jgi:hypothetical protein